MCWQLSIQFRTFSPNAVILLVDSPQSTAYYGLYVVNGQVVMVISSGGRGSDVRLSSGRVYNDGQWYQVINALVTNGNTLTLKIEYVCG